MTPGPTPSDLAAMAGEILRLDEKATPGPWTQNDHSGWAHPHVTVDAPGGRDVFRPKIGNTSLTVGKVEIEIDNAEFIAAARTSAPVLARAYLAAEKARVAAEEVLQRRVPHNNTHAAFNTGTDSDCLCAAHQALFHARQNTADEHEARVKAEGERDEAQARGTDASTRAAQLHAELDRLRAETVPIHARTEDAVCGLCGERVELTTAGAITGALAIAPHPNTRQGPYCKGTFTYDWHHSGHLPMEPSTTIRIVTRDANGGCVACGATDVSAPNVRIANAERLRDLAQDALQEVADYWRQGLLAEQKRALAAEARVARLGEALLEVRAWRRSAVGLEPQPTTDAETLGARIDAALADTEEGK